MTGILLILLPCTCFLFALVDACVNSEHFEERVVYVGEGTGYRLRCPLAAWLGVRVPQPGGQQGPVTWLRDCQELPSPSTPSRSDPSPGLFLEFHTLGPEDQGNYTCLPRDSLISFTVHLVVREAQCSRAPEFRPGGGLTPLWGRLGSTVRLNCTALVPWDPAEEPPCAPPTLQWSKDGHLLTNRTEHPQNTSSWSPSIGHVILSSLLEISLQEQEDFGLYLCVVRNTSDSFQVQNADRPSHTAAVIAAVVLLLLLSVVVLVYSKHHLNIKLWYRNTYGDYELNDGKLYDAYVSYVNNEYDRKFVNFILKPNLAKHGHKLHLNENNILPGAGKSRDQGPATAVTGSGQVMSLNEPSAELLMNVSRSRRLVVVLSHAYLEQDWCTSNFRQGLLHLLELSPKPIFITLEGQMKRARAEVREELREQQHRLTLLTWKHNSVSLSSVFWKELVLALPRRVDFHCESARDPQTMRQEDKDPMLTLDPDSLDWQSETDPAGDLGMGLRLPVYRASGVPVLGAFPTVPAELKHSDIDVSDLGSRNYGARTDFYCLVTKEDM